MCGPQSDRHLLRECHAGMLVIRRTMTPIPLSHRYSNHLRLTLASCVLWLLVIVSGCNSLPDLVEDTMLEVSSRQRVLVVHGLFRTQRAMRPLHPALRNAGFDVIEYRYTSTQQTVETLATELREYLLEQVDQEPDVPLHVIGHSLGAVIAVKATSPAIPGIGRVVQISPPNRGSPVAKAFEGLVGPWILSLEELSNRDGGPIPVGSEPGAQTGVIAAKSDAMVPIESTELAGAMDRIVLPGSHTFVFWRARTQQEIIHFLIHGQFSPDAPRPD